MNKVMGYNEALAAEEALPPGPYEIRAFLEAPLSKMDLLTLKAELTGAGVILSKVSQSGSILSVKAIKPRPVEGIAIVPFVAAVAIIGTLAISFYTLHELPRVIDALVPLTLIIVIGYAVTKTAPIILGRRKG